MGRQLLRYPIDVLVRLIEERIARSHAFMDNATLSAKLYAYRPESASFVLPDDAVAERIARGGELPVRPPELWEGYVPTLDDYLSLGREHFGNMIGDLRSRKETASSISAARPDGSSVVWRTMRTPARFRGVDI